MSRSNPSENQPNPAVRWFEWNGEKGLVRYYDKEKKENVDVGTDFTFMLLDEVGGVTGWHDASESGIYSNEVRDTRTDILIVKSFKGGVLAEGLYKDIKDRVCSKAIGGQFVANCYIAFKQGDALAIGSLKFKGAALGAWMEFRKAHRGELYEKAVKITGYVEGKKGRIVFRTPTFAITELSKATDEAARAMDKELQTFLKGYFARTKKDQVESAPPPSVHESELDNTPLPEEPPF